MSRVPWVVVIAGTILTSCGAPESASPSPPSLAYEPPAHIDHTALPPPPGYQSSAPPIANLPSPGGASTYGPAGLHAWRSHDLAHLATLGRSQWHRSTRRKPGLASSRRRDPQRPSSTRSERISRIATSSLSVTSVGRVRERTNSNRMGPTRASRSGLAISTNVVYNDPKARLFAARHFEHLGGSRLICAIPLTKYFASSMGIERLGASYPSPSATASKASVSY